jgi:hypothetical protein
MRGKGWKSAAIAAGFVTGTVGAVWLPHRHVSNVLCIAALLLLIGDVTIKLSHKRLSAAELRSRAVPIVLLTVALTDRYWLPRIPQRAQVALLWIAIPAFAFVILRPWYRWARGERW